MLKPPTSQILRAALVLLFFSIDEEYGAEVRYLDELHTTFGQRFMSDFIMILPVEQQL